MLLAYGATSIKRRAQGGSLLLVLTVTQHRPTCEDLDVLFVIVSGRHGSTIPRCPSYGHLMSFIEDCGHNFFHDQLDRI